MTNAKFTNVDWKNDRLLLCPMCFEPLNRNDIEQYARCPFCDCKIDMDTEIEDYILKPVVDKWIYVQHVAPRFPHKLDL